MLPFDPPENIRKPKVFRCFQGDQEGTLGGEGLRLKTPHIKNSTFIVRVGKNENKRNRLFIARVTINC